MQLVLDLRVAAQHPAEIRGRAQVGEITSAVKSPIRLRATVVKFPHFDPEKSRVKGNYPPQI